MGEGSSNNPSGRNLPICSVMSEHPDLPTWIQAYIDDGVKQSNIPKELQDDHGLCSMKIKAAAILGIIEEDPLFKWGTRKGLHLSSYCSEKFIDDVLRTTNLDASTMCQPGARKVHTKGLWGVGPNEEWCVNGREKILICMGISVWSIIDEWSHDELDLCALPDSRTANIPRLYSGMPLQTTSDMGSKTRKLAAAQTALRQKELSNVKHAYESGKITVGFHSEDPIHKGVSLWLWAKIERWSGRDVIVKVDLAVVDQLIEKYAPPGLFQFGTPVSVQ
ncbi:hypothetical protein R3P38DRAFT_3314236 [Favolaschia claudopus]|uniref:Uncharacterized protein n=1 Tax=Favolaschia claudopus TaxID=2862362 RepID=A0AAW0BWZ5_9AGAR